MLSNLKSRLRFLRADGFPSAAGVLSCIESSVTKGAVRFISKLKVLDSAGPLFAGLLEEGV